MNYHLETIYEKFGILDENCFIMYRAVSSREFEDIKRTHKFRVTPNSLSAKQFTNTILCAVSYGEKVIKRFDKTEYFIISTKVLKVILKYCHENYLIDDKECPAITIYEEDLEKLNNAIANLSEVKIYD